MPAHDYGTGPMMAGVPPVDRSELSVMARLAAGDERALGELYDRHGVMAFSLALSIVSERADAEEVVADAFAQVWRNASSFDAARGSPTAWLSTIVHSRALDLLRSRRRRARVMDEATVMTAGGDGPATSASIPPPDHGVELSEAQRLVRQSLGDLPETQRKVLELAYFGGLSQTEIAERLAEPLGTVKTRMRSGMEKLRTALRPVFEARA